MADDGGSQVHGGVCEEPAGGGEVGGDVADGGGVFRVLGDDLCGFGEGDAAPVVGVEGAFGVEGFGVELVVVVGEEGESALAVRSWFRPPVR